MNSPPITRILNGVLHDAWVDHDNCDVLLHGDIHTVSNGVTVVYRVTIAIPTDDAPAIRDGIDQEADQLRAGPSAIDDHDPVADARLQDDDECGLGGAA